MSSTRFTASGAGSLRSAELTTRQLRKLCPEPPWPKLWYVLTPDMALALRKRFSV